MRVSQNSFICVRVHHYILMCVLHHMICFNGVAARLKPCVAYGFVFMLFGVPARAFERSIDRLVLSGRASLASGSPRRAWRLHASGRTFFVGARLSEQLLLLCVVATVASAGLGGGGSQRYAQPAEELWASRKHFYKKGSTTTTTTTTTTANNDNNNNNNNNNNKQRQQQQQQHQ